MDQRWTERCKTWAMMLELKSTRLVIELKSLFTSLTTLPGKPDSKSLIEETRQIKENSGITSNSTLTGHLMTRSFLQRLSTKRKKERKRRNITTNRKKERKSMISTKRKKERKRKSMI